MYVCVCVRCTSVYVKILLIKWRGRGIAEFVFFLSQPWLVLEPPFLLQPLPFTLHPASCPLSREKGQDRRTPSHHTHSPALGKVTVN